MAAFGCSGIYFVKALKIRGEIILEHNVVPIINNSGRALLKSLRFINGLETFAERRSVAFHIIRASEPSSKDCQKHSISDRR